MIGLPSIADRMCQWAGWLRLKYNGIIVGTCNPKLAHAHPKKLLNPFPHLGRHCGENNISLFFVLSSKAKLLLLVLCDQHLGIALHLIRCSCQMVSTDCTAAILHSNRYPNSKCCHMLPPVGNCLLFDCFFHQRISGKLCI